MHITNLYIPGFDPSVDDDVELPVLAGRTVFNIPVRLGADLGSVTWTKDWQTNNGNFHYRLYKYTNGVPTSQYAYLQSTEYSSSSFSANIPDSYWSGGVEELGGEYDALVLKISATGTAPGVMPPSLLTLYHYFL